MFKSRLKVFLLIMAVGVAVLIARLGDLQLLQGQAKKEESDRQLTGIQMLNTIRGQIRDRTGSVLANDEACYDFCLDYGMLVMDHDKPLTRSSWAGGQVRRLASDGKFANAQAQEEFARRLEQTWTLAEQVTGVTQNEMARSAEGIVRRIEAIRKVVDPYHTGKIRLREEILPHPIITGLDEKTAVELRSHLNEMVGASVQPSHRRWYPAKDTACHLVGWTGDVNPGDAMADRPRDLPLEERLNRYFEGDHIGKAGAEKLCEDLLRGQRGYREVHKNGDILQEVPPRMGQDVHLTIDVNLQRDVSAVLGKPGAVVVIDVASGEVLAAVSLPTYDLNEYRHQIEQLSSDNLDFPLLNRCVGVRYPPGSTAKPLAALAALSTGVITPGTVFNCRGYLYNPGEFRCDVHSGHGEIALTDAIKKSCNVYFYNVGQEMKLYALSDWMGRFGFANEPGTGLPEECRGILPDPRLIKGLGEARYLAIGQGKICVTPMHVANAMATIARNGEFRSPVLVKELAGDQRKRRLAIPPEALTVVQEAMREVVNETGGTAYNSARDGEIEIAGKTGTAQTSPRWNDTNGNGRMDEDEIQRSGDTAWFAGFAPARHPQIAFAVLVEYSDVHGATVCGPIAKEVVKLCRKYGYLN